MILALDLGSTNLKAGLFDARGELLAERLRPLPYTIAYAEFDVQDFGRLAEELINEVCAAAGRSRRDVQRIGIASQAQTFTILDAQDRPRMPFLSWIDPRAGAEATDLAVALGAPFHRHCSFPEPTGQLELAKLLWVRRHHPDWLPPDARVVPLPTYLAWRLSGLWVTDRNLAAMSGLYSMVEGTWWPAALGQIGIRAEQLPALVEPGQPVAATGGSITMVLAGNDQTANAYGNVTRPGELLLVLGTALVVYRRTGAAPGPYRPATCWGPYPGGGYYELAVRTEGCAALDWAREALLPDTPLERFMELACGSLAAAVVPLFYPVRMNAPDAWEGQGSVAARARAVIEGICFSVRQLIEEELGMASGTRALCVCGGGSRSDGWLQMLADVLGAEVRRGTGDALRGAALMALEATATPQAAPGPVFRQEPGRVNVYATRYQQWMQRRA